MNESQLYKSIRTSIDGSQRNAYVAELHLQVIKYSDFLENVTGKEFCERLGIGSSYGVEFAKMKKISQRLKTAGLDPNLI